MTVTLVKLVLLSAVLILSDAASLQVSGLQLRLEGDFDAQVTQFINTVHVPKNVLDKLPIVINDLEQALQNKWPGCKVIPFGSIIADLAMITSDLDVLVALPNGTHTKTLFEIVIQTKDEFNKHTEIFTINRLKTDGYFPLVELVHLPSGIQCDINFNSSVAVRDSKLLNYYMNMDVRAYHLTMVVKYWSRVHRLKEILHIRNFNMIILVVFYLQQLNIVPAIAVLQRNAERNIVKDWNTGYDEIAHNSTNDDNMYQLLGGFFKYYSKFDFDKYVVSIYTGRANKKSAFRKWNTVPDEYEEYKYKVSNNLVGPLNINTPLVLIDPFDHHRNSAEQISPSDGMGLQYEITYTANLFKHCNSNRFLSAILTYRPYIKQKRFESYCVDENMCINL